MALEDDVREAIDRRFKISPTNVATQVHGPLVLPPEKLPIWEELKSTKDQMPELARRFDQLVNEFWPRRPDGRRCDQDATSS